MKLPKGKEMEKWAYNYPFTAAILRNENPTPKETMELIKLGKERRG